MADVGRHRPALRLAVEELDAEAVLRHERFVRPRSVGAVSAGRGAGVGRVQQTSTQHPPAMPAGVSDVPLADEAGAAVDAGMALFSEDRDGASARLVPSARSRALPKTSVQRASRSFWRSFTGFFLHASGTRPTLISTFSASVLRCRGVEIRLASTICPAIGMAR